MKRANQKRWTAMAAMGMAAALLLTGCGGGAAQDTKAAGSTAVDGGNGGGAEQAAEPVTLTMWAMSDDEKCYNAVIEAYQKDHPNVSVELVLYSSPEIDKALTTALAGRDDIDLFVTNGGQYLAAKVGTGMAENLDSYIEASGLDVSIYGSDYESTLYDDGSAYGLPYRNSVSPVSYTHLTLPTNREV